MATVATATPVVLGTTPAVAAATTTTAGSVIPWIIAAVVLALIIGGIVGWLVYRARYQGSGVVPPAPTPTTTGFSLQSDVNTVRTNLADLGLSQRIADPAVGIYAGSAATRDACETACRNQAGCVQYVYDGNARPANPLWQRNGCWLRLRQPTAAEVVSEAGYTTGTRTVAPVM